jgi:hypothetical protein
MWTEIRLAVILTHDRPDDFLDCLHAIEPQVDYVFVVSHRTAYASQQERKQHVSVIPYQDEVPNISKAWNLGLRRAEIWARGRDYRVAVLNDDAVVPSGWFATIADEMTRTGAAAGAAARQGDPRMAGFAFILNGRAALFADEQFEWWFGDDDLAHRARAAGGVAQPQGLDVEHRHPNSTTVGVLAAKATEDRFRFYQKWGYLP